MADVKKRIADIRERLSMYYTAEKKILSGQSYTIGSRQLTRANLAYVQDKISDLENELDALESRGTSKRRSFRGIPVD